MDSQTVEIVGRNRLTSELVRDGLEVAVPLRDRGVDLIAYVDLKEEASRFIAVPIQMKAASFRGFSIDAKYKRISNLLLVYVWNLRDLDHACTFALTYPEALDVAREMGWTETASWRKGRYVTSKPSKRLLSLLSRYLMVEGDWREKIGKVARWSPS